MGTRDGRPRGERLGRATPPVSKEPEHGYTSYVDLPVPGRTELSTVTGCYVEPTAYGTSSSGGGRQDGMYHPWNRPVGYNSEGA